MTSKRPPIQATPADAAQLAGKAASGARFDMADLLTLMAVLRTPAIGCPWDVEQTFASIAPYTIEEAYEVADAIQRGDFVELKYELGDLLLQAVFHAQIAAEEGRFAFDDIVDGIARKMVRRHPHVFGDETERGSGIVPGRWEQIKAEEAAEKRAEAGEAAHPDGLPSLLDDVPIHLPGLTRAVKLQNRAAKSGFDWPNIVPVWDKLKEEVAEFEAEVASGNRAHMVDEFGDLLFVFANVARHLKIDPEAALRGASAKFERRFRHIERRLAEQGRAHGEVTLAEMDELWDEAKALEKTATGQ